MSQQYEQESSSQYIHALLSSLLHQGIIDNTTTELPGSSNDSDNVPHVFRLFSESWNEESY